MPKRSLLSVLLVLAIALSSARITPPLVVPTLEKAVATPQLLDFSSLENRTKLTAGLTKAHAVVRGFFQAESQINSVDVSCNVDDQGQFGAKARVSDLVPGLAVQLSGGFHHSEGVPGRSAGASAEYTFQKPGFSGRLGFERSRLAMSGVLGVRNALLGCGTDFDADTGAISEPLLMARYTGKNFMLSAMGKAGGSKADVTLEQRISESLKAAASFTVNSVTLGLQHESESAVVRAKLDSTGPRITVNAKFDA
ncbi:hypothetical protein T484DRAFT_1809134 [Baffinella frigidus]|nr:hypothetical protein T484DRAFT_1809134 [Cryptophyta sp. CCMP2293]